MTENIREFIVYHNEHVLDDELIATSETISTFAAKKNIALADISIDKHRLPFINWITSLISSET
jgi:hypothetical protein